jgi:hypothetical protein
MKTLGESCHNLDELYMKFEKSQQVITLKRPQVSVNILISTYKMAKQCANGMLCFIFYSNYLKGMHVKVKVQNSTRLKEVQ